MPEHPADLQLFDRTEVARMLGLPYRQVVRAGAKLNKPGLSLTLSDVCLIAQRTTDEHKGEFVFERGQPVAYRPLPGVIVKPGVSFGRPCLEGTGIKTSVVASRVRGWESIGDVAIDYDVDEALVRAAVEYEGR